MVPRTTPQSWLELEKYVEAYESARLTDEEADLAQFLPEAKHPLYKEVLLELVRVDLEHHWLHGQPRRLEEYQRRFPHLQREQRLLQEVAFEEYRLRHQAGETPTPEEYRWRFGVDTTGWPHPWVEAEEDPEARLPVCDPDLPSVAQAELLRDLQRSDPAAAQRLEQALTSLPAEGSEFLGFQLLTELGRGAFGKVYLARQSDLADRPIVLKISSDLWGESQTLAQLQHTNIVPIYSVHRRGPLQAVCMPYFGSTTLADLIQVLRQRPSLPASGKGLVETLESCKSLTWENRSAPPPVVPLVPISGEAAGEPASQKAKAPLPLQKLGTYTYVEAVLWIGARLADGLEHAHERGILHRDLKPANILLTDDGQPMLLDFNLSADLKLQSSVSVARTGGTLPYMAPEQLEALRGGDRPVDARSDVYSLGVCLHELLTGQHAFPLRRGPVQDVIGPMIADRQQAPPSIRKANPAVPPAVASLLQRCLAPEPSQRYQSARELQEDLERQLEHRPLRYAPNPSLVERARKWIRRHPRGVPTGFALVAAILLLTLAIFFELRGRQLARWQAREILSLFEDERAQAQALILRTRSADEEQVQEGRRQGLQALERYQVLKNPQWQDLPAVTLLPAEDQERLRRDIGDLLLLLARTELVESSSPTNQPVRMALHLNHLAESCYTNGPPPLALWKQRAALAQQLQGRKEEAELARINATETAPQSAADLCLLASEHTAQGHFLEALPLLHEATRREPQNFWAWYSRGICYENLAEDTRAEACFDVCSALWPSFPWTYYHRGLTFLRRENYPLAAADFDQVLRLRPGLTSAYVSRALARLGLKKYDQAIADLTTALDLGATETRIYFMRATARARAGDQEGARQDRAEGLRRRPTDAESWSARGVARLPRDVPGALADFEEALKRNPHSLSALQNKAHVLAEIQGRTEEGVQVLNEAVAAYPGYVPSRASRGVLLARLGKRTLALKDAEESLARDSQPATLYQVAGIYALTSQQCADDRLEALRLLSAALRKGYGLDLLARDPDLDPIRKDPEFTRIVTAAQTARSQAVPGGASPP